jgi:heptaprenyl diphosphate synthase
MTMKPFDLAESLDMPLLPEHLEQIQARLVDFVATDNSYLQKPLTRILKRHGKMLRPALVLAVAGSQKATFDNKMTMGCIAIELLHIASLVHDDVIDEADIRHNQPTISHKEGVDTAILVGDYLIAQAYAAAAESAEGVPAIIAEALRAMCDGQALETADTGNLERTITRYNRAIQGKTAALISAACQIGTTLAHSPDAYIEAFSDYGNEFGLAFQIMDDILDLFSTPKLLGKPVGSDIRQGIYTLPVLLGLQHQGDKDLEAALILHDYRMAKQLLLDDLSFQKSLEAAGHHTSKASVALQGFDFDKSLSQLRGLPWAYVDWALDNLLPKPEV